jgi:hypothetical protein
MSIAMLILAGALAALPHVTTQLHVIAYATAMGVAGGAVTVIFFAAWGHAFGRAHLGKIQGAAQMLTVIASALGPVMLAQCMKWQGSYTPFFYSLLPIVLLLCVWAWIVRMPTWAGNTI